MKNTNDIVVTGIGTITPIGLNKDEFFANLIAGVSGADYIKAFDTEGFTTTIACELKNFLASNFIDKKNARKMSRF